MNLLHRFSIRHPRWVLSVALLVTLAIAPGMFRLRLRTDGHALVPPRAAAVLTDREVRREFGVTDPLVVLLRPRDAAGILNPATLRLVARLTLELGRLPGVDSSSIRSLATEVGDHLRPGTLSYHRLLDPIPTTRAQLDELAGDLRAIELYTGTLVSFDYRSTAILVGVPEAADRTALLAAVHGCIAGADTSGHRVDLIGAPAAEALLGTHILEDLGISLHPAGRRAARFADRPDTGLSPLARLRIAIARHLGLLPLSIVVMALVFAVCFGSVSATLLPLLEAGACLVFVFGLMGWTGVPVYLTMAVLPVILVSMGLADEIHIFTCYSQHRIARPEAPLTEVVSAAMDEMSMPVVATAMTTAIGFLSFAISPLEPVRAFGLFTAVGIVFCMLWTLTVIPAMLLLFAPRAFRAPRGAGSAAMSARPNGWQRLSASVTRRPALTLALAALALAMTPFGFRRLAVQDSWVSGFAKESEFYQATQAFNREYFGTHRLLLALDTGRFEASGGLPPADLEFDRIRLPANFVANPQLLEGCSVVIARRAASTTVAKSPGDTDRPSHWESIVESATLSGGRMVITTPPVHGSARFLLMPSPRETLEVTLQSQRLALPAVLRRVEDLERFARAQTRYTVGGVLGPADHITTAEFLLDERDPQFRSIPSDPDRVRWLWTSIGEVRGESRLRDVIDPQFRRGLVTLFLKNANYVDTAHLMNALRRYEREQLTPYHIRMEFAGDVAVSQALIEGIVRSQVGSLLASLLGIFVVLSILFRSLRWGALCMVPAGFSVAATFAAMGWWSMPLGVATSMFAGMVLGIGVDFAIHLAERFRLGIRDGATRPAAIAAALTATGPAIVVNALAVALGFGILVLSRVPANAQLGTLTVMSLTTCLVATLLVVPALLRVAGGGKTKGGD